MAHTNSKRYKQVKMEEMSEMGQKMVDRESRARAASAEYKQSIKTRHQVRESFKTKKR